MEHNRSKKFWELPEWKITRDRLLKDYCEQCQKRNSIFALIHLKPTPKARIVGIKIRKDMINELIDQNKIKSFKLNSDQASKFSRNICPECNSLSLRERKRKKPKYKCNNCSLELENPNIIIDYENYELRTLENKYYSQQLSDYKDEINTRYQIEMGNIRELYLSGEDTATYCKSCAFQFRKGRSLCQNCKEHYHTNNYEMCFYCVSIPCEQCGQNRILKQLNENICNDCIKGGNFESLSTKTICKICNTNKVEVISNKIKVICDRCVLDGHWLE